MPGARGGAIRRGRAEAHPLCGLPESGGGGSVPGGRPGRTGGARHVQSPPPPSPTTGTVLRALVGAVAEVLRGAREGARAGLVQCPLHKGLAAPPPFAGVVPFSDRWARPQRPPAGPCACPGAALRVPGDKIGHLFSDRVRWLVLWDFPFAVGRGGGYQSAPIAFGGGTPHQGPH